MGELHATSYAKNLTLDKHLVKNLYGARPSKQHHAFAVAAPHGSLPIQALQQLRPAQTAYAVHLYTGVGKVD